ncbi:MAG TPA: RNA degradosome polyphosphate kinase, partial [Steroidobacter sp.]|nr:RNA degradosome polyphosphate kinase [Steroidobacter sp.]
SRVYYFHNDGSPEIFCASADWMERNFFRRIEVCFPIERKQHRDRIVEDLQTYLADNEQAWVLRPDGKYERASANGAPSVTAQQVLLQRYSDCND